MGNDIKYLVTKEEKFPFIYSLNVMEAIQKKYGSLDTWSHLVEPKDNAEPNIEALIFFFEEAINDGIDLENEKNQSPRDFVNKKKVGRIITEIGLTESAKQLKSAVISASNDTNENSSNDRKNEMTTQSQL